MTIMSLTKACHNSRFIFSGAIPFPQGLDAASPAKRLAGLFSRIYSNQFRFTQQHGWLCRDGDETWRPDERGALQIARQFAYEAARQTRSPMLAAELLIETMLRLAELEPGMRAPLPDGDIQLTLSAQRRAA